MTGSEATKAKNGSEDRERGSSRIESHGLILGRAIALQLASCQSRSEWVNERSQTHEEENHKKQQVGNLGVVAFVISVFYLLL